MKFGDRIIEKRQLLTQIDKMTDFDWKNCWLDIPVVLKLKNKKYEKN